MHKLWFAETVLRAFGFLISKHGFAFPRITGINGELLPFPPKPDPANDFASVVYEKQKQYVIVCHGSYGREVDVLLGIDGYENRHSWRCVYIDSMLDRVAPNYSYDDILMHETLENKFSHCIREHARALEACGQRFFAAYESLFVEIRHQLVVQHRQLEDDYQNKQHRQQAIDSFRGGEWQQVVDHYAQITHELTSVEQKRLAIATNRIQQ